MTNGKRTWQRFLKMVLIVFLCLSMTATIPGYALADKKSDLEEQIRKQQEEIDKAQKEKKSLKDDLTDVEKIKKSLVKSKNSLAEYVEELDAQVAAIQERIDTLTGQITEKEAEITETQAELADAQETADTHYASMKVRIQTLYEQGELYYVEVLAASGSFGDFLNKLDYINQLSAYDNNKMNEYKEIVRYVTVCKEKLEAEEEVLVATKDAAQQEETALEELIAEKEKEITAYEKDIANQEKLIREYEAEIAEQTAIIEELEKAVEQAKKDLRNQRVYDGGKFCWPAPDYTRISDDYGYRTHPITGKKQFHTGVDMAAPGGSPILAAYTGDVIQAAYNATMGNYIMIDHGNGLYTIYMHAQKLLVKPGDVVSRGQKIATVGTTGRSTGNHLHFSVRLDGVYVSPWDYITKP
ncbi:MAG: peptidoglycan DD-metalloendopeptidase family protein [Lachnospiraceae bacterium]|nr:peptidoglycan DD-metalloendopeptidase family protein [Lachnospiraceae bacterium]